MLENEEIDDPAATAAIDETDPADPPAGDPPADKDWEAEYKAQQKINRDLERRTKARMRELEAEIAAARAPKPADDKPDLDALRKQVRDEARAESLKERALDKLEAKAAKLFQDPEDARAFLASSVDDFIDGDSLDVQAISDALTDLLEKRPYLGVTQRDEKRFKGTGDQGPKGSAGKPPQVTEAQLKTMTPDQIVTAQKEGRLKDLLGG